MSPEDRKQLIEKCAKAMGIKIKGFEDGTNNPAVKGYAWTNQGWWTPFDLADCAAMNAELDVATGYDSRNKYSWAEIETDKGIIGRSEDYANHNGNKEAAWMMASARCVAATQEG